MARQTKLSGKREAVKATVSLEGTQPHRILRDGKLYVFNSAGERKPRDVSPGTRTGPAPTKAAEALFAAGTPII